MLSLAQHLLYDDPPAFYLSATPGSAIVKRLAWYRLAPNTRKGYTASINSYVSFCVVHNEKSWSAPTIMLEEGAVTRIFGNTLPKQGQLNPDAVPSYLLALKSYHIDRRLSLGRFYDPQMALTIKGRRRLFSSKKRNCLFVTKEMLEVQSYCA